MIPNQHRQIDPSRLMALPSYRGHVRAHHNMEQKGKLYLKHKLDPVPKKRSISHMHNQLPMNGPSSLAIAKNAYKNRMDIGSHRGSIEPDRRGNNYSMIDESPSLVQLNYRPAAQHHYHSPDGSQSITPKKVIGPYE